MSVSIFCTGETLRYVQGDRLQRCHSERSEESGLLRRLVQTKHYRLVGIEAKAKQSRAKVSSEYRSEFNEVIFYTIKSGQDLSFQGKGFFTEMSMGNNTVDR